MSCSHGGANYLVQHCTAVTHQKLEKERRTQLSIGSFTYTKKFLTGHNLPIAAADHLSSLIKECFLDSKIAQSYSCPRTKSSCILNGTVYLDFQRSLTSEMEVSF